MRTSLCVITLGLGLLVGTAAQAGVLDFEDLVDTTLNHSTPVPAGYGGLYWIGWDYYSWTNPPYAAASGVTRLLHKTMYPPTTPSPNAVHRDGQLFVFEGASFAGYSSDSYPKAVAFALYYGGTRVHVSGWLTPSGVPAFLASGYALPVDRVEVLGDVSFAALDDFQYSLVSTVPEPQRLAMLLAGLVAVVGTTRRRRPVQA